MIDEQKILEGTKNKMEGFYHVMFKNKKKKLIFSQFNRIG